MARGFKKSGGVKGPSSALTEFLKSEGITDAFRQRRAREAEVAATTTNTTTQETTPDAGGSDEESQRDDTPIENSSGAGSPVVSRRASRRQSSTPTRREEDEDDDEIIQMRKAAKRKLRAARRGANGSSHKRGLPGGGSDSNDDSSDDSNVDDDYSDDADDLTNANMKGFGDQDTCVDCGDKFELSVYSRFIKEKSGYLCDSCNKVLKERERRARTNQLNARKKRKRVAQALLNRTTVKIPKLQDVCIKKITQNIEDVDVLGDIGQVNLNKISSILSKNRSLNDKTISLFLSPDLKNISFWDCSNVDSDSLNKIASYCPNLESLTLFMCGQLHNDNLEYFASNLRHLNSLSLNGPFLISDKMWQAYFNQVAGRLQVFEVRNTHRFGNESLLSLLENCGKDLTSLKLSRLDGITTQDTYSQISKRITSSKLQHFEVSYPTNEDLVTDDIIIEILQKTGDSLVSLNVDGCSALTEKFLLDGVSKYCRNLTKLSMKNLDQVSNEGFATAFNQFSKVNAGGLIEVNLMKCTDLGDEAIYALLNHSCHTLVELSINSLHRITSDFLSQNFTDDSHQFKRQLKERHAENLNVKYYQQLPLLLLTYLDASFVRAVDNEILSLLGDSCPKLQIIEVYGDNRCNGKATFRDGLMVIGRQSDEI
ncbi:Rad7 protein [Candida orthopsilosis Co 90-125]|uniref:Rad7 protein n=1 Tax=Candida orthopsilosis (strain 90-125) TaxID=1136231 RepID=H8WYM6_CANO9|nr:Rad7 protein [Candida orthopsilosis Co 90-125]CCG21341.1 Rad7 protein [Candida orthopsilosis Co 90-125]